VNYRVGAAGRWLLGSAAPFVAATWSTVLAGADGVDWFAAATSRARKEPSSPIVLRSLLPLGLGLFGHRALHCLGQLDVLQFHEGYLHAPLHSGDVENRAEVTSPQVV
jgi:hypothetical protein